MKLLKVAFIVAILGWTSLCVKAQVNTKVENFTLRDLQSNTNFSLSGCSNYQGVVLVFVNVYCPYSKSYKGRIQRLREQYKDSKKIKFIIVNPECEQDTKDMLEQDVREYGLTYLLDKGASLAHTLQATKVPEVFVLQQAMGHFVLKYQGAIDDNPQLAEEVGEYYLKDAIQAVLNKTHLDKSVIKPTGCMIKK